MLLERPMFQQWTWIIYLQNLFNISPRIQIQPKTHNLLNFQLFDKRNHFNDVLGMILPNMQKCIQKILQRQVSFSQQVLSLRLTEPFFVISIFSLHVKLAEHCVVTRETTTISTKFPCKRLLLAISLKNNCFVYYTFVI